MQPKQNTTNIGEGSQQNDNPIYNNSTVRKDLQIVGRLWGDAVDSDLEEEEDVQAPSFVEKYLEQNNEQAEFEEVVSKSQKKKMQNEMHRKTKPKA